MPLEKAHKRRRRAFLADLTRKKHCPSSMEPRVNTVPASLDSEIGAVSMETNVAEGEFGLAILFICSTLYFIVKQFYTSNCIQFVL